MMMDIAGVRSAYPALRDGFVHLDGAGGTQAAEAVTAAVAGTLRRAVSNRGNAFAPARRSGEIVAAAREAVADLVGGEAGGVVFGASATALTYLVARTLAQGWTDGDEVVVTRLDHDANVRPWVQSGATVRWADVDVATGELGVEQFRELVGPRTRLVAVTGASNAIGTIPDVAGIAAIAHAHGALVYVDGVHAAAHRPVDIAALGADFYVTSAYKWSGPHYAAVVAAPSLWDTLHPVKLVPSPAYAPDRFEFGTLSFELLAGVTAAVDHLAGLAGGGDGSRRERLVAAMTEVTAYEKKLTGHLAAGLAALPGISVLPAAVDRCPTISFRVTGQAPADTARLLGEQGIGVSHGDYYAAEYFEAAGLRASGGAVRASLYHYTTVEEIDRLLEALAKLL
jgi:cysteine desulfurase family protein (TIGR01976 family)